MSNECQLESFCTSLVMYQPKQLKPLQGYFNRSLAHTCVSVYVRIQVADSLTASQLSIHQYCNSEQPAYSEQYEH